MRSRRQLAALLEPTEHQAQALVVAWAQALSDKEPDLELLFAVPNQGRAGGRQGRVWGARMAREGLRGGVPDLVLPVARQGRLALFVEMKRAHGGRVMPAQRWWHERLEAAGNRVVVAHGAQEAIMAIWNYLRSAPSDAPPLVSPPPKFVPDGRGPPGT